MTEKQRRKTSARYRIQLKGILAQSWMEWFEGMSILYENNNTILEGPVKDHAHLHGILNKIRDLNLILLSVEAVGSRKKEENL